MRLTNGLAIIETQPDTAWAYHHAKDE